MVRARSTRRLLLALTLGVAACLALPDSVTSLVTSSTTPASSNGQTATECIPNKKDACEDLGRCSLPTVRLAVPEDAVLVLGNSGCGKSTLSRLLSGDDGDMRAVTEDGFDFLIEGAKIGSRTTSVTKIPDLMRDNLTNTNYFDCPGFEDTRGSCVEVSTTFYMKDILWHARRVKVLLLTPGFAVARGGSRDEFPSMLLHAARVLRSVDKLRESVALIVTKMTMGILRRRKYVELSFGEVKEGVAAFLREDALPSLARRAESSPPEEADDLRRAVELIHVFLAQNEQGDYPHIGILRNPDEEGLLKDNDQMHECRRQLLDVVHKSIRYADVGPGDFGFSVSDRTKLFALQQSRNLGDAVAAELAEVGRRLAAARAEAAYNRDDIAGSAQRFAQHGNEVRAFADNVGRSDSVLQFCDRLATGMPRSTTDGETSSELSLASRVAAQCRQLDVLQTVSDTPLVEAASLSSRWSAPLQRAADDLAARADWNRLLVALYDRLNALDQQVKRFEGKLTLPPVTASNLSSAVEPWAAALGLRVALRPEAINRDDLTALLARVAAGPQYECLPDGMLVVRGESVLLSEVAGRIANNSVCGGGNTAPAIGWVQVYALNTVFVDRAVRLPGISLAVVAPRWEVVGDPLVDLSGLPGDAPARKPREAAAGQRGSDGEAGKPGRPGGHFVGVGLDFAGRPLRVAVNGGRGGDGQHGGDGSPSRSGGGNGFDGGDGGAAGRGGKPGTALVISLEEKQPPRTSLERRNGLWGKAGRGGSGGDLRPHTGVVSRQKRVVEVVLGVGVGVAVVGTAGLVTAAIVSAMSEDSKPPPPPPVPVYHNGKKGKDGASRLFLRLPADPVDPRWNDVPARTVAYLELNQRHPYRAEQLKQFKLKGISKCRILKCSGLPN